MIGFDGGQKQQLTKISERYKVGEVRRTLWSSVVFFIKCAM